MKLDGGSLLLDSFEFIMYDDGNYDDDGDNGRQAAPLAIMYESPPTVWGGGMARRLV